MKLKQFDAANYKSVQYRKPTITLSTTKSRLSKSAADLIGAKEGDGLLFFQDEENPTDWYVSVDKSGVILHETKYATLAFYSACLTRKLFESLNVQFKQFSFTIAKESIKHGNSTVYPILTAAALKSE